MGETVQCADPVDRLVAWVIDTVAAVGLRVAVAQLPMDLTASGILLLAVPLVYHSAFLGRWGQTPGKWLMGIRVVRQDGTPITYGTAFVRTAHQYMLAAITVGLSYLSVLLCRGHRSWYDQGADTVVVCVAPGRTAEQITETPQASSTLGEWTGG